jgi:hypothetical protein
VINLIEFRWRKCRELTVINREACYKEDVDGYPIVELLPRVRNKADV